MRVSGARTISACGAVQSADSTIPSGSPFDFTLNGSCVAPRHSAGGRPQFHSRAVQTIEVDISQVDYLDSGALGMLVLLNESARNGNKSVSLISLPGPVADVLKVANVDKLFSINLPSGVKLDLRNK